MLALTNFNDIISSVNVIEATQFGFDKMNNAIKLSCPIQTKHVSHRNTIKPFIHGRFVQISRNDKTVILLFDKNKKSTQFYARFRNFVTNRTKLFCHKFEQLNGDLKITWKQINNIIRPNRINERNIE